MSTPLFMQSHLFSSREKYCPQVQLPRHSVYYMSNLFNDIVQLSVHHQVLLLSTKGNVLYRKVASESAKPMQFLHPWKDLITQMGNPQTAQFNFESGLYFLLQTQVGYIVVGLSGDGDLASVKAMCDSLKDQVTDPVVRKKVLLQTLTETDFSYKAQVVYALAPLADSEVAKHLVSLMKQFRSFPQQERDQILLAICRILGDCSEYKAIESLESFLRIYTAGGFKENEEVVKAAKVSVQQLQFDRNETTAEQRHSHMSGQHRVGAAKTVSHSGEHGERVTTVQKNKNVGGEGTGEKGATASREAEKRKKQQSNKEELQIKKLLVEGKKGEAVAIIMRYIEAAARQKMFVKAENLRDKLIEIDSMNLSDIIRAAEIIEAEKAASIEVDHLSTWHSLVEMLSQEEFSALYHSMSLKKSVNGETVVRQSDFLPYLIFVNSGHLRVFTKVSGKEIFLKTVEQGEVLGAESFFESSVWTVSVRSTGAELFILRYKDLENLGENYPALESKLIDFCALFPSPNMIFRKTQRSRRRFERKSVSGRVAFRVLDKKGKETGEKLKGDLYDISCGGISFCVRFSRKKNAGKLFGNKIEVCLPSMSDGKVSDGYQRGSVVAVRGHHIMSNEYSVHIQFDTQLSLKEMQMAIQLFNRT